MAPSWRRTQCATRRFALEQLRNPNLVTIAAAADDGGLEQLRNPNFVTIAAAADDGGLEQLRAWAMRSTRGCHRGGTAW